MKRSTSRSLSIAFAALGLVAAPSTTAAQPFKPVPIGVGAEYQPPARWPLAGAAAFGGLRGGVHEGQRVHIELFANRQVVVVPGGIGVSGGRLTLYGNVLAALWHASAWTLEPGGVVHVAHAGMTLGDVFAVWGQPLGPRRLLAFAGPVLAWVNGAAYLGDPAGIPLRDRDQIVIAINGEVEVHPMFAFKAVRR